MKSIIKIFAGVITLTLNFQIVGYANQFDGQILQFTLNDTSINLNPEVITTDGKIASQEVTSILETFEFISLNVAEVDSYCLRNSCPLGTLKASASLLESASSIQKIYDYSSADYNADQKTFDEIHQDYLQMLEINVSAKKLLETIQK